MRKALALGLALAAALTATLDLPARAAERAVEPLKGAPVEPLSVSAPVLMAPQLSSILAKTMIAASPMAAALPVQAPAAIVEFAPMPSGTPPGLEHLIVAERPQDRPQIAPEKQAAEQSVRFDGARRDPDHPFEAIMPPDLGKLDSREIRVKTQPAPEAPGFLPAGVKSWLERRMRASRERSIRGERMLTEEIANQETLVKVHALIKAGDPQTALDELSQNYDTHHARAWYTSNALMKGYWQTGMAYYRVIEAGLKRDIYAVKVRSKDRDLIREAQTARERVGGAWRRTEIQEKGSGHCGFHAWFNALAEAVGFTRRLEVSDFIAAARAALNEPQSSLKVDSALAREFGLRDKPRDVGEGLDAKATKDLAAWLGIGYRTRPTPGSEAELLSLMRSGAVIVPSLRFFHEGGRLDPGVARVVGHDHAVAYHAVYLLGAFKSEKLGRWVYMTQDSGSGTTDFYTFDEFRHLTRELELLEPRGPVVVPQA